MRINSPTWDFVPNEIPFLIEETVCRFAKKRDSDEAVFPAPGTLLRDELCIRCLWV